MEYKEKPVDVRSNEKGARERPKSFPDAPNFSALEQSG
jgi:hypothetical protein